MDISSLSQITSIPSLLPTQQSSGSQTDGTSMFQNLFDSLIGDANSTDAAFNGDIVKASEGELDNPEQLMIDSTKANISLNLVSNLRTSALDAYNDIIKMSV